MGTESTKIAMRYIVEDVDAAVGFYEGLLGFEVVMHPGPGFAMLQLGGVSLLMNVPGAGGAGQAGGSPQPGGWNRIQVSVDDLDATVARLRSAGAHFRGDIVDGNGGRQVLVEDPSGNPVELFEPKAG